MSKLGGGRAAEVLVRVGVNFDQPASTRSAQMSTGSFVAGSVSLSSLSGFAAAGRRKVVC